MAWLLEWWSDSYADDKILVYNNCKNTCTWCLTQRSKLWTHPDIMGVRINAGLTVCNNYCNMGAYTEACLESYASVLRLLTLSCTNNTASKNFIPDIMHDVLEGAMHWSLASHYIVTLNGSDCGFVF